MTTNIGKHCIAANLLVEKLRVTNNAILPGITHGTGSHEHQVSSNGSVVYFKYAFVLEVDKFIATNGSPTIRCVFKDNHHFDGTESGVKIQFSGGKLTGNLRGLDSDEFLDAKIDLAAWDSNNNTKTMTFDVTTSATSDGDVTVSAGMVGTILIYKYMDLAGPGTTWQIEYDQAPASLHS